MSALTSMALMDYFLGSSSHTSQTSSLLAANLLLNQQQHQTQQQSRLVTSPPAGHVTSLLGGEASPRNQPAAVGGGSSSESALLGLLASAGIVGGGDVPGSTQLQLGASSLAAAAYHNLTSSSSTGSLQHHHHLQPTPSGVTPPHPPIHPMMPTPPHHPPAGTLALLSSHPVNLAHTYPYHSLPPVGGGHHPPPLPPAVAAHFLSSPAAAMCSALLYPHRSKRIRTAFTPAQLAKLETQFNHCPYVVGHQRRQISEELGLSETQVKVWFQNRRTKEKRVIHPDDQDNICSQESEDEDEIESRQSSDNEEPITDLPSNSITQPHLLQERDQTSLTNQNTVSEFDHAPDCEKDKSSKELLKSFQLDTVKSKISVISSIDFGKDSLEKKFGSNLTDS